MVPIPVQRLSKFYIQKNDGKLKSINYSSIPLTSTTHATILISKESTNYNLKIDTDGDGLIDQILPPDFKVYGSAYNYPQTATYKATFSVDITGPSSPSGSVNYYYSRTRMNFVSSAITSLVLSGNSATIMGTGTVNGTGNYTFTATVTDSSPDSFGLVIRKADGSLYYSTRRRTSAAGI